MIPVRRLIRGAMLMLASTSAALGQTPDSPQGCTAPVPTIDFGITDLDCLQCIVHASGMLNWVDFGAEPVVRAVTNRASPIQPGDVLVALDGKLITGFAGARLLAHPEAGHAVRFTVRRNGRQMDISVLPGSICPPDMMAAQARMAAVAAAKPPVQPMSQAARDSFMRNFNESMARLHDTIEFRYERDAYGRPYHFTFNGDSSGLDVPAPVRTILEPDGRALLITDSVGRRKFYEKHPARGSGFQIGTFGFADQPSYTTTLPDGIMRTISNGGRDTTFTIPNGGKGGASSGGGRDSATGQHTGGAANDRGWLGFGLECRGCTTDTTLGGARWRRFSSSPIVVGLDAGGPADRAGVRAGDVLRTVDGIAMTSADAVKRLGELKPGQSVQLTIDRKGQSLHLTLTVGPVRYWTDGHEDPSLRT